MAICYVATRTVDHPEENLLVETLAKPRPFIPAESELPKKPAPQLTAVTP